MPKADSSGVLALGPQQIAQSGEGDAAALVAMEQVENEGHEHGRAGKQENGV